LRPLVVALEDRSPVSSLVPGIAETEHEVFQPTIPMRDSFNQAAIRPTNALLQATYPTLLSAESPTPRPAFRPSVTSPAAVADPREGRTDFAPFSLASPNADLTTTDSQASKAAAVPAAQPGFAGGASKAAATVGVTQNGSGPAPSAPSLGDGAGSIRPLALPPGIAGGTVYRMDGSGGGGGVSGGGVGKPALVYSGGGTNANAMSSNGNTATANDMIGDSGSVTVSDQNGQTIATVTWTVPSDAIQGQIIGVHGPGGFTNYPVTGTANARSFGFAWDQNPGTYTITADLTYVNAPAAQVSIKVNVQKPDSSIVVNSMATPTLTSTSPPVLRDGNGGAFSSGINWTASITTTLFASTGVTATYGVVQTTDPYTLQRSYYSYLRRTTVTEAVGVHTDSNGNKTQPRPLLDDGASPSTGFIYDDNTGTITPTTTFNNSIASGDSPSTPLDSSYNSYTYTASFTMTLMLHPNAGIWVPLGSLTWSMNMYAVNNSGTWVLGYSPSVNTAYTPTTTYPSWADSYAALEKENQSTYGWVQIS
jgi:hypothetical protein